MALMSQRLTEEPAELPSSPRRGEALNHVDIGTEHILLGLIHERTGSLPLSARIDGLPEEGARSRSRDHRCGSESPPSGQIPFTPRAKKVLELSLWEALQLGHNYIGTEHILLGLIR